VRIIMLGPPGSGKGTQAQILSELYCVPVITTGDMLRDSVDRGTRYGKLAKDYMERGDLVPDGIVNRIVGDRLKRNDLSEGFILDGYPRSIPQADALDKILDENNQELDYVIHVVLDDESIIDRLSKRRVCPNCGAVYHLESNPPKIPDVCDECGSKLIRRNDDSPDVIRKRLKVYREKTKPLLERYEERGIVVDVPGDVDLCKLPQMLKELLA
jgi:adenylate kinase